MSPSPASWPAQPHTNPHLGGAGVQAFLGSRLHTFRAKHPVDKDTTTTWVAALIHRNMGKVLLVIACK